MLSWPDNISDLALSQDANHARIETAAAHLADILNSGTMAMFVGTGISTLGGLPVWGQLNRRIVEMSGDFLAQRFRSIWSDAFKDRLPKAHELDTGENDPLEILDSVESVCSSCESLEASGSADADRHIGDAPSWHALIRAALYESRETYEFEELFHPELVSLASLLIGHARGIIREVITFNYDDLLESYLDLHGHVTHVITPVPTRVTPNSGTIFYHPHGYLPLQCKLPYQSPFLVLSKRSYDRVRSGYSKLICHWRQMIAWVLCVRIGLFIGISGNDEIMKLYFDEALNTGEQIEEGRPLGYAILMGDRYLSPEKWLKRKIVPLEFRDTNAVAKFLAKVCQLAVNQY